MQANTFHPPNLDMLSENVIGSVVQHSRPERRLVNAAKPELSSLGQHHNITTQGSLRAPTATRGRPRIASGHSRSVRSSSQQPAT
ncbi:hypothetical protein GQ600_10345 [Phytophthora cactorum]|nr:hypothetical protein GQ600_289 [Phytophthora cactorum]KAF1783626.1 hypothetical protein GQ600_10345 [Phytophthora cactorum]